MGSGEGKGPNETRRVTGGIGPDGKPFNDHSDAAPQAQRTKVASNSAAETTYFAPFERAKAPDLERTIHLVTQSPVTTALLRSATSMMCVLNEHRQIVTLNTTYLDSLDVAHADDVMGLRPGEAMNCAHSTDHPGGCGTSAHCRSCDVAIAIVASQRTGRPVQRECVVPVRDRNGKMRDMSLAVRASPFELKGERFTVFCMTDISSQKAHAALERTFLHDLSNLVTALAATSETLRHDPNAKTIPSVNDICDLTQRLSREIIIQRLLLTQEPAKYRLNMQHISITATLGFLERLLTNHPATLTKSLNIVRSLLVDDCVTDPSLLERILTNMLINAFEATHDGKEVRLAAESSESRMRFTVWNAECMTDAVASRIFQRHFSTKKGLGRGQGTYAIRLLGETLLHGQVGFTSSPEDGTTFFVDLPRVSQASVDRVRFRPRLGKS